jgi:hypothetical protein
MADLDSLKNLSAAASVASTGTIAGGAATPVMFSADTEPTKNKTLQMRWLGPRTQRAVNNAAPSGGMKTIIEDFLKGPYGPGDTATFGSLPKRVDPSIDPGIFAVPNNMPTIGQREYDPTILFDKPEWDI